MILASDIAALDPAAWASALNVFYASPAFMPCCVVVVLFIIAWGYRGRNKKSD